MSRFMSHERPGEDPSTPQCLAFGAGLSVGRKSISRRTLDLQPGSFAGRAQAGPARRRPQCSTEEVATFVAQFMSAEVDTACGAGYGSVR
jgi:hypothetical protein